MKMIDSHGFVTGTMKSKWDTWHHNMNQSYFQVLRYNKWNWILNTIEYGKRFRIFQLHSLKKKQLPKRRSKVIFRSTSSFLSRLGDCFSRLNWGLIWDKKIKNNFSGSTQPIKRDFGLKIPSTVLNNIFVVVVIAEMLKFIEPVDH